METGTRAFQQAMVDEGTIEVKVGTVSATDAWTSVTFGQKFDSRPIVLAQSQTHKGGDTIVTRIRNVTTSGFEVRVQEEEARGSHTTETIGYVAIEPGTAKQSETLFGTDTTSNAVTGMGGSGDLRGEPEWYSIGLPAGFFTPYKNYVALLQQQTTDGGNTGSLRARWAMPSDLLGLKYWTLTLPGGEVIGRVKAGGTHRYYVKDHLGSIRAVLDGSGAVKESRDYYPFGLPMPGRYDKGSPPTKEDFTGHVKDEATGLHYAGARYYSAAFGRWTTTDPILGEKGAKELLKGDPRLLTMTSYNYAFGNPATLTDPTGLAPTDWYRDENGKIKYDKDVQSQADLKEGQTYLGENALKYQADGRTKLLTEGGERVNVFDEGASKTEEGAKGASGASVPAAAQKALLDKAGKGGKALSRLKGATKAFGRGATGVSFALSSGSELIEGDRFGTYEKVQLGADVASLAASTTGVGAAVSFTVEVAPAGNGMTAKERGIRFLTRQILEAQVDVVVSQ